MKNFSLLLAAAGISLTCSVANATWVSISGTTVDFAFDDSLLNPMYGSYSVSGDTLSFSPVDFSAERSGTVGFDLANATTPDIKIMAKTGFALTELSLSQEGNYFRFEDSDNSTAVSVGGQFIVDSNPNAIKSAQPLDDSTSAGDFFGGAADFSTTDWSTDNSVMLNNPADSATAKVQSLLLAAVATEALNMAFIEKTLMSISADTIHAVPIPGAIWLFGSAMAGFLASGRKIVASSAPSYRARTA